MYYIYMYYIYVLYICIIYIYVLYICIIYMYYIYVLYIYVLYIYMYYIYMYILYYINVYHIIMYIYKTFDSIPNIGLNKAGPEICLNPRIFTDAVLRKSPEIERRDAPGPKRKFSSVMLSSMPLSPAKVMRIGDSRF